VIANLKEVKLCDSYLCEIIFGFGYSRKGIEYSHDQRVAGVSKFPCLLLDALLLINCL
jgi:hypothetical protein